MKLINSLSTIFLTTFLSLFIISDASAVENRVVPNGKLGEFRHGTFPSPPIGDFTHVGVDIIAPCGSDIYAFSDGKVKDIIDNTNDKNFNTLGYMVLIEHPASLIGKKFYTLYLHMQRPPEVIIGSQVTGGRTVIGNVGSSGKTLGGCHTHFEIRYFPERFSVWGNIYCPDDQRYSEYFKQNWEDPLTFFRKYPNRVKLVKTSGRDNSADKSKLILGRHKHEAGVIEYFNDGTFMLNTDTGEYKKKAGKWNINGDILALRFYIHPKPYKYKILELSASTYKIARISVDRNTYNAKRTDSSKQSPVYVAKNSRAYHHNRNCSNITTTDGLMEFSSPQKAVASGGILCEHCNLSAVVEENTQENNTSVVVASTERQSVYHSSVAFILTHCGKGFSGTRYGNVRGDVPLSIDLGNDAIVKKILNDAKLFAREKCTTRGGYYTRVKLYQLDEKFPQFKDDFVISAEHKDTVDSRDWSEARKWYIENNTTIIANKKLDIVKKEKENDEATKRRSEFASKNSVKAWPSIDALYANPFIYEGKSIAIVAFFKTMESATSGIFMVSTGQWSDSKPFFVSSIPKNMFRTSGTLVVLAGKVLGKTETALPLFGLQVPHLKFVAVHFCKDNKCSDIIPDNDD